MIIVRLDALVHRPADRFRRQYVEVVVLGYFEIFGDFAVHILDIQYPPVLILADAAHTG